MNRLPCTLCDLPTPDPPVTVDEIDGVFCCTGCLHVFRLLRELDEEEAERVRRETIRRRKKKREWEQEHPPDNYEETFLKVEGMHCSICESFIESMSRRRPGIYKSEASYATEMVKVYYDPVRLSGDELPDILSGMGYRARAMDSDSTEEELNTVARLIIGGFFSIIGLLLYILFLYPTYLEGEGIVPLTSAEQWFFTANIFVMTSFVLTYTGYPILRGAWVSLSVFRPNMDLLITIAALSAYLFSTVAMISGSVEVYFDVTMAIIMVVSIGNYYESSIKRSKNRLLSKLMEQRTNRARIRRNGDLTTVELEDLEPGDQVIVRAGERIPIDGTVVEGQGVVNEALITGESLPVSKQEGDRVASGTILTQNALTIETGTNVESTVDKLIHLMWEIQATRSGKQRLADRIAAWFVPFVLVLGAATFAYYYLSGSDLTPSMLSALAVLIVSCPCALGLATPLAVASGIREALKNNIIFKTGAIFEEKGVANILAFDKTGTLTTGEMTLLGDGGHQEALRYARALEQYSSHPLAKAIVKEHNRLLPEVKHFESTSRGVSGVIDHTRIYTGQPEWLIEMDISLTPEQESHVEEIRQNGYVPVVVAWKGAAKAVLVVGDRVRDEAESFINTLKQQGKQVAIITGDSETASRPLQNRLEPDFLFTGAKPESKTNIIRQLRKFGPVAMIGDGSNDAPALAEADLGIAFGDLTAIAAESAQIVIPVDRLQSIPKAFEAIKLTKSRIRQNLGWAFLYNITTIPLAVAGLINPLFAALAMAGSSLIVVGNSSRGMKLEIED